MGKQKRYSLEFRERAVRRMKLGDNISRLSRELGIDRSCLYIWKRKLEQRPYRRKGGSEKDWRDHRMEELEAKITRLEGIIGSQWLELDFFESALRRIEGRVRKKSSNGGKASMPRSEAGCERKAD